MAWKVFLFESKRGEKPVEEFIKQQRPQAQAKITHNLELLEQYGPRLGMPQAKFLRSGIYELRIRGQEELRILYCFKSRIVYLLHAFKKQTQKTPKKEIAVALQRFQALTKV